MAHRITIPQPDNNYIIGSSFNDLFKVIAEMESTEDDEITWDFSNVRLLNPFFYCHFGYINSHVVNLLNIVICQVL